MTRIERLDGRLNAFHVVWAEQARADADAADARLRAGETAPLLGVPVAVKDSDPVAGHAPAWGTGTHAAPPARDSERVRRLREAGAVVVGTTPMPELALWPFTESRTWGATRNPWSLTHTPGGSSGGSAAAVASGMVAAALASDGGGSIRVPAACCHLVGLKPTVGTVPGEADDAHWEGLSSCGVLTRDVADQAHVLSVLAGRSFELPLPARLRIAVSDRAAVPGVRLAGAVRDALERACALLADLGHEVRTAYPAHNAVALGFPPRYAVGAAGYLRQLAEPWRTERRTRMVTGVGDRLPAALLARAHRVSRAAADRLGALPGGADVLLTPVLPGEVQRVGRHRGRTTLVGAPRVVPFTGLWNVTGRPALSLPVGRSTRGLPVAVQLVGAQGADALLLGLAAQLEAALGVHRDAPEL